MAATTVDSLGPARVRLRVEVPFDELPSCLRQAVGDDGIAGFRTGRLPFHAIDRRLGATVLRAELEAALMELVLSVEEEHGLRSLGRREIQIVECGPDRSLVFTATVDVRPHIDVPDLSTVVVELGSSDVDATEVDAALEELRDRLATADGRPALDDAFAARWGEFATLQELRAAIRDGLAARKDTERLQHLRDATLAQISADVAEPPGVVADEAEQRQQWMLAEFRQLGMSLAEYLAGTGRTEEQLYAELREVAAQKARSQLVLDAVADAEDLGVSSDEAVETIARRARRAGLPADAYYNQLARTGGIETVIADVRRAKALAFVLQRVSIVDESGRPVTFPAAAAA